MRRPRPHAALHPALSRPCAPGRIVKRVVVLRQVNRRRDRPPEGRGAPPPPPPPRPAPRPLPLGCRALFAPLANHWLPPGAACTAVCCGRGHREAAPAKAGPGARAEGARAGRHPGGASSGSPTSTSSHFSQRGEADRVAAARQVLRADGLRLIADSGVPLWPHHLRRRTRMPPARRWAPTRRRSAPPWCAAGWPQHGCMDGEREQPRVCCRPARQPVCARPPTPPACTGLPAHLLPAAVQRAGAPPLLHPLLQDLRLRGRLLRCVGGCRGGEGWV